MTRNLPFNLQLSIALDLIFAFYFNPVRLVFAVTIAFVAGYSNYLSAHPFGKYYSGNLECGFYRLGIWWNGSKHGRRLYVRAIALRSIFILTPTSSSKGSETASDLKNVKHLINLIMLLIPKWSTRKAVHYVDTHAFTATIQEWKLEFVVYTKEHSRMRYNKL